MASDEPAADAPVTEAVAESNTAEAELSAADLEIEEMQKKVQEMEEEAEKLRKLTDSVEETGDRIDQEEVDRRSIYVGQVDYGSTPEELQEHFKSCGEINRITILVDKFTGSPKGFAYIEFADEQGVQTSLLLNGSLFRGRQLKVNQKRTNVKGFNKGKGKGKTKAPWKGKYMPMMDPYMMDPYGYYGGYGMMPPMMGKGKGKFKGYSPY